MEGSAMSIKPFDCNSTLLANEWEKWKNSLEICLAAYKETDPASRKNWLLHLGGSDVIEIFNTVADPVYASDDDVYAKAIKKLDSHFSPKRHKRYERHLFRKIRQNVDEKFDKFVLRIRQKASLCEFGSYLEDGMIDQIIEGCTSKELRQKCLAKDMTYQEIIQLGLSLETVEDQLKSFKVIESDNLVEPVHRIQKGHNGARKSETVKNKECFQCGRPWFIGHKEKCPAFNHKCRNCGKVGHLENKCFSRKRSYTDYRSDDMHRKRMKTDKAWNVEEVEAIEEHCFWVEGDEEMSLILGGLPWNFVIDSGATSNFIAECDWRKMRHRIQADIINPSEIKRKFVPYASHMPLNIIVGFKCKISVGQNSSYADFFVIKDATKSLLGKITAKELKILRIGLEEVNHINDKEFPCFKGISVKLDIDKNVRPVCQPLRRTPLALEEKIEKKINELLALGIIERVEKPSEWVSPVVPVGKSDGDLRLCIDMRRANQAMMDEVYPIKTFEEIIAKLEESEFFSKIDLKNAYHQVTIEESTRYITTFITKQGQFQFKRLTFGVVSAPKKFQKIMDFLLCECEGAEAYIDDVVVWGKTVEEHNRRLQAVLKKFAEYNVLINEKKCQFGVKEIEFMGHKINKTGIFPIESKVEAIKKFRSPENVDEVRSFLGTVTYLARFIQNLATISEPLRKLLKKDERFVWKQEQEEAFQKLKMILTSESCLGFFRKTDLTQLFCDASPVGLGAVLVQQHKSTKESRVIAYASRSLSSAEQKYFHTEKEALSLVWGVEKFKYYLHGISFELITDCKALEFLFTPKSTPCARLERWILRLMSFKFKVIHKSGKQNIADALSRLGVSNIQTDTFDTDTEEYVYHIIKSTIMAPFSVEMIKEKSESDNELKDLKGAITSGIWPKELIVFKPFTNEICELEGVLLRGTRLIPPSSIRKVLLETAHEGHLGMVMMKRRLRTAVWWPNMDREVENFVKNCRSCILVGQPNTPIPTQRRSLPSEPWEDVAVDFLGPIENEYILVAVDYFSRYIELSFMTQTTAKNTIFEIRAMIGRHGYPRTLTADNGPQFKSEEFRDFCAKEGIELNVTTPYWPQANGEVERQNRSLMKRIKISIQEERDWKEDLLIYQAAYHSTPHSVTGEAPGKVLQKYFRDKLPHVNRDVERNTEQFEENDKIAKEKGREYINNKRHAQESDITEGDIVLPQKLRKTKKTDSNYENIDHTVLSRIGGETVIQNNETDKQYRRHVNHLVKVPEQDIIAESDKESESKTSRSSRVIRKPAHLQDFV